MATKLDVLFSGKMKSSTVNATNIVTNKRNPVGGAIIGTEGATISEDPAMDQKRYIIQYDNELDGAFSYTIVFSDLVQTDIALEAAISDFSFGSPII